MGNKAAYFEKKDVLRRQTFKWLCAVLLFLGWVHFTHAQTKQYWYDPINVSIKINQDSTFDVEERQVFHYVGKFNKGWRSISLNKVSDISDISVVDGETGKALTYSRKSLDKLNSSSWGKFNYFKENGAMNIEWYYDLADTSYEWVLKYKVHGGIEFNPESDRLYWNIFTDYDVTVKNVKVTVLLPEAVGQNNLKATAYRNKGAPLSTLSWGIGPDSVIYAATKFPALEDFTIDVTWSKGIVSERAFWWGFAKLYYGYILSPIIIFLALLVGFFYWLFGEKLKKGRGTIIPQYEPPRNLRPAMAEVIVKEKLTEKGLAATVIDLAIRGYLTIEKDSASFRESAMRIFITIFSVPFILFPFLAFVFYSAGRIALGTKSWLYIVGIIVIVLFGRHKLYRKLSFEGIKNFLFPPNYILRRKQHSSDFKLLEDYEVEYLRILFASDNSFSTRELKKNPKKGQALYQKIKKLKNSLYEETESDIKAYEVGISREKMKWGIWGGMIFGLLALFYFGIKFNQFFALLFSAGVSALGLWAFINYEARLSHEGRILKEDWLGFKLYLETAERYRMQNLTPETFEKYLPYAMIFGIEKKWAKAFEGLNMPSPSWYSGGGVGFVGTSAGGPSTSLGASGFSPSAFSASFSSSFTSAFSSSGAGGGGGGGGGAGGGGGGGGGGGAS